MTMTPQRLALLAFSAYCLLPTADCSAEEPLPIRRVELPPERVAAEMGRVGRGVLTQLPREQFEELVKQAAAAEAAGKDPPRLVEARYTAALADNGLSGTAEWKVAHGHDAPGRLSLAGLQLALRSARWSDGASAVIGMFNDRAGAEPQLLVNRKGERTLKLEWSARGVPELGGLRFDLRVPACLVTVLDLELPADHSVIAERENSVLSGPLPGADASKRQWRLTFPRPAGAALSARLSIRHPPPADQPPSLLRVLTQTTQKLTPGQVECDYQFDVQVQRGDVQRLTLELDPELRPLELLAPGLDGWTMAGNRVEAQFREPFRGGRLTLRALAPLPPPDRPWVSPGVRFAGGLSRGERLTLHVDPDLRLEDWKPGTFRPLPSPDAGPAQVVALQSVAAGPEAGARPAARVRSVAGAFRARENWEWRIEPGRMTLTVEAQFLAGRGAVFQSAWQVPAGWQVERVEAEPPDPGLLWSVQPASRGTSAVLTVEPRRALGGAADMDPPRLLIRLRADGPAWSSGPDGPAATAVLPAFAPRGVEEREGTLTLRLHSSLLAPVAGSSLRPDAAQSFRGRPEASVPLRRRRSRLQAHCDVEATIGRDLFQTTYQLDITPVTGVGQEFLIATTAPVAFRSWRSISDGAQVRGLAPVPVPLGVGRVWLLSLDRPPAGPVALELVAEPRPTDRHIDVPLLAVAGAEQYDGRVVVRSVPSVAWRARAEGLVEEPVADAHEGWARRAFSHGRLPTGLTLDRDVNGRSSPAPRLADATLVIQPTVEGTTLCRLRCEVLDWSGLELPIGLPAGARSISAQVDGAGVSAKSSQPDTVVLPWNPARPSGRIDMLYLVEGPARVSIVRVEAAEPVLPVKEPIRRVWRLPVGTMPVSFAGWRIVPRGPGLRAEDWFALMGAEPSDDGWTNWEPVEGESPTSLWVARWWAMAVPGAAVALALALLVTALPTGRRAALAAWLLAGALGVIWLPPTLLGLTAPLLATGVAFLVASIARALGRRRSVSDERPSPSSRSALGPVAVGLVLLGVLVGTAAPPEAATVYIVPALPTGGQAVLAPPDLLESLRKSARQAEPSSGAVLTGGRYEGVVAGGEVRWKARFAVNSVRDASVAVVALPDVQLLGAEVDGRPALPRAGSEAGRFEFNLADLGEHTLALRFATPAAGERDRETRFSIPELPLSSCTVEFPAGVTDTQVLSARGVQHDDQNKSRIEADLGRSGAIHVRWRLPDATAPPRAPAHAAHLWEVGEAQSRLVSVFRFRFSGASTRWLEFDVPAGLELADASVRHVDDPLRLAGLNGMADWRVSDTAGGRRHRLEFAAALTGHVQVELELVPQRPLDSQPVLSFPEVVGDFERESAAAVRLTDLGATVAEARGWARLPADDFFHEFWQPLRVDAVTREPDLAFRRTRDPAAQLQLDVKHALEGGAGSQQLHWLVGAGRAELHATATWPEAPGSGPLEWEVPAVVNIVDVRGEGLRSWSRTGSRLQAWLTPRSPGGPVSLMLTGLMPRPTDEQANAAAPFTAAPMKPLGPARVTTDLTVQAREGWRLAPRSLGPYLPLPTSDLPGVAWSGSAVSGGTAVFALHPARGTATGDVMTMVDLSGRQLVYQVVADVEALPVADAGVATLQLELRRAAGDRPALTLPPGVRLRETRATTQGFVWVLDCRSGRHRLALAGKLASASASVEVPAVTIRGPREPSPAVRRFVAVGPGVRAGAVGGLQAANAPGILGRKDLKVWQAVAENWELRVSGGGDGGRGRLIADVVATSSRDGRWLVRANYFTFADPGAVVRLPEGAELLVARIDGLEWPRGGNASRLALPGSAAEPRLLTLVWQTPPLGEQPRLNLPRLEVGGELVPYTAVAWAVLAPTNGRVELGTKPASAADAAVRWAAAIADFNRAVDDQLTPTARARLRTRLNTALTHADLALAGSPGAAGGPGPDGQTWEDWMRRLQQNAPPGAAVPPEPEIPFAETFRRGTPTYWFAADGAPPDFRLASPASDDGWRVLLSILVAVGVAAGAIASVQLRRAAGSRPE
jgi:hypothetical protein